MLPKTGLMNIDVLCCHLAGHHKTLLLLLLHAEIRVTLSHKNVAGAPYRIIVNAANSPQWLMSVAKGVTE